MSYVRVACLISEYLKASPSNLSECALSAIFGECVLAIGEHSPKPFIVIVNFSEMGL